MENLKVLVVDDSDLIYMIVEEFLVSKNYTCIRAKDGLEAVYLAYHNAPDIILMDVEMPGVRGYQASRLLKSRKGVRDIPIIMHTTLDEDKDRFWAMSCGADDFLSKDLDHLEEIDFKMQALSWKKADKNFIKEESSKVSRESIIEMLALVLDRNLLQSTILNEISSLVREENLRQAASEIFRIATYVSGHDIACLILKKDKTSKAFIYPGTSVFEKESEEFYKASLADFKKLFSDLLWKNHSCEYIFPFERTNFKDIALHERSFASYLSIPLNGAGGLTGSLHVASFANGYFSSTITENLNVFASGAGLVLSNALLFEKEKEQNSKIRNVFSKFVPADVIEDLISRDSTSAMLTGEKRNVAILFTDIRSFTTISENNDAGNVVGFLNRYFSMAGEIIKKNGGIIDKFIGDAILAVFGAVQSYEDNATRAVRTAIEIKSRLKEISTDGLVLPEQSFSTGVGVHEGQVIVGNIGSGEKFDYTVIGDTVNLASRLEGLTKHYHQSVIVSATVYEKTKNDFIYRELDRVRVKGKEEVTIIYGLRPDGMNNELYNDYEKALSMYRIGNWNTAMDYFQRVLHLYPDPICEMYLERCRNYCLHPPQNFDGTTTLDFK